MLREKNCAMLLKLNIVYRKKKFEDVMKSFFVCIVALLASPAFSKAPDDFIGNWRLKSCNGSGVNDTFKKAMNGFSIEKSGEGITVFYVSADRTKTPGFSTRDEDMLQSNPDPSQVGSIRKTARSTVIGETLIVSSIWNNIPENDKWTGVGQTILRLEHGELIFHRRAIGFSEASGPSENNLTCVYMHQN